MLPGAVPTVAEAKEVGKFKVADDNTIEIRGYKGECPDAEIPAKIGIKTVTAIAENAFKGNAVLKSIRIPEGITRIEAFAFYKCPALTDIAIPDGVTTIGEHAFSDCKSLTSITIPSSVSRISEGTFSSCEKVTAISIPKSVTIIDVWAFVNCKQLIIRCNPGSCAETYAKENNIPFVAE